MYFEEGVTGARERVELALPSDADVYFPSDTTTPADFIHVSAVVLPANGRTGVVAANA